MTDLGIGAALTNASATRGASSREDSRFRGVLRTSIRILLVSSASLTALVVVLYAFGLLGRALNTQSHSDATLGAAVCFIIFAANVPLSIGQRLLVGADRTDLWSALVASQSVITMGSVVGLVRAHLSWLLPVAPMIAYTVCNVVATYTGLRGTASMREIRPRVVASPRKFPGARVAHESLPMIAIMIANPIAINSDRLILAHSRASGALASYSLAFQFFAPIYMLVSTAGMALWPVFARRRQRSVARTPLRMVAVFGGVTLLAALSVTAVGTPLANLISHGHVTPSLGMYLAFTAFVFAQAVQMPIGMYLTDAGGLRVQSCLILGMLIVNIYLSLTLANHGLGFGPALASGISIFLCQFVPGVFVIKRRHGAPAGVTREALEARS